MTAVAIVAKQLELPAALEQEILARIDRAGLQVCEAELRYTLRWDDQEHGSLLELLDELEHQGLIESALHFRLTDRGRAQLPDDYEPPLRYSAGGITWQVRS
jgi:DNA-binding PadR family transcriptional regulator